MITQETSLYSRFSLVILSATIGLLTGCLGSAPKRDNSLDFLHNRVTTQKRFDIQSDPYMQRMTESLFPVIDKIPIQIDCHDRETKGSYSEDMSAHCVRSQTLKAYEAFELKVDPEIPYCILRQESSNVKNDRDPYDVDFDRLAVCGGNGKKYCGVGLAQTTFSTWAGYDDILANDADKKEKMDRCLNMLSNASNQPRSYSSISFRSVNSSNVKDAIYDAKTEAPSNQLSPFYRDHAICVNALHISELRAAKSNARAKYAIRGKGKKRRKVYLSPSIAQAERIGAAYNGGGTAGYGSAIGQCVSSFRKYDETNLASADSIFIKPLSKAGNTVASREANNEHVSIDHDGNIN